MKKLLDACTKYPWQRPATGGKFGVYDADHEVFAWLRDGAPAGQRRCVEAQVMDLADDVAYSVHDLEDGVVAGRIDLARMADADERRAVWHVVRDWYLPDAADDRLDATWERLLGAVAWPGAYDGTRASLAALKNLTSDVIGIFCGAVWTATREAYGDRPLVRYDADLVVPDGTRDEIAVLKGIAAHYVMRTDDRRVLMERQETVLRELFEALRDGSPALLDPQFREDLAGAPDDASATRVLLDQVASLTDASAVTRHAAAVF